MKRFVTTGLLAMSAVVALASVSFATPNPTLASIKTRIYNDCPSSTVTTSNLFPASITITDNDIACFGFANLHNWSFSDDGTNQTAFPNNSAFIVECDFMLSGPTDGEGGLRFSPWWSTDTDGLFNLRTTDGEIACFGGRLPFFSFSAPVLSGGFNLRYVKGTTVHLKMEYHQNGLSALTPATIQYTVVSGGTTYQSPKLNYDQGNAAEDPPHGLWGCLNDGFVGGAYKAFLPNTGLLPAGLDATWSNISFQNLDNQPVPARHTTWGQLKSLYSK
jgi:hypothetical protein